MRYIFLFTISFFLFNNILVAQTLIVKNIQFSGNETTKSFVLQNELPIKKGDTINMVYIDTIKTLIHNNLLNTSLFNFVFVSDSITGSFVSFYVKVIERWYVWVYPILEHADRNFSSFLYNRAWNKINYGFALRWYNFRGRRDFVKIKTRYGYKQQLGLTYYNPYAFKSKQLSYNIELLYNRRQEIPYDIKDNMYEYVSASYFILREKNVRFQWNYRYNLYSYVGAYSNWIQLEEELPVSIHLQSYNVGLLWTQDYRNLHYYPTEGVYKSILLENFMLTKQAIDKITIDYRYYHTFVNRINLSSALNIQYLNTKMPFYYLLNNWDNTFVRGIYLKVLPYQGMVNLKTYVRYNIIKRKELYIKMLRWDKFAKTFYFSYAGLFFDAAYVYYKGEQRPYYSAGVSFDFVTYYDKVFRIEIAYNSLDKKVGIFLNLKAPF